MAVVGCGAGLWRSWLVVGMTELIPCPHCGGNGHEWQDGSIWCLQCAATAPNAETWNTRTFIAQQTRAPYMVENASSEIDASVKKDDAP